jgi:hypothetical protein
MSASAAATAAGKALARAAKGWRPSISAEPPSNPWPVPRIIPRNHQVGSGRRRKVFVGAGLARMMCDCGCRGAADVDEDDDHDDHRQRATASMNKLQNCRRG